MGSWDQNLHVLEHLARHFGFPNQSYQAPTVTYILENLNQISGKLEIHTKTQKCTYFGENIYFLQGKKYVLHFRKIYAKERKLVI